MKQFYILLSSLIVSLSGLAQDYDFGIVQNSTYNFSIVAIPDVASSVTTDVSDIGFTLVLPAGMADVMNPTNFNGRAWTNIQADGPTLQTNFGIGDGSRDAFILNLAPGASPVAHGAGEQIVLTSFDVSNMPTSGLLEILGNSDPLVVGLVGLFGSGDSFYNVNLDGPGGAAGTTNQYVGIAPGLESFDFSTLGIEDHVVLNDHISIYPNPATKFINISSNGLRIDAVEMFDLLGKRVLTSEHKDQLMVDQLPAGVYLLKVYSDKGKLTKKIIIEQ